MTEKRFTLHKGVDTLNIMDNTKFHEHIYINKSSKDMELLVGVLNALHEENIKIKTIIMQKLKELEYDYEQGAKAGMPTGAIIGEIYTFEEICKEMDWLDD